MKKTIVLVSVALLVGFVLGAVVFRGGRSSGQSKKGGAAVPPKDEIWTCSMHPNVRAPKPGLCPICAMDLIPLSSMGASGGERDFSMSESAKKLAGISTVPVLRMMPQAEVSLFGKVVYDESRKKTISARFDGRIDDLFVDYTGVRVMKDEHLAVIYSPDLLTAQSELLTALKFGNQNGVELSRDKLRLWGFSKDKINKIESTRKVLDQLTIDAPASGIVTHLNVSEGDYVKTGTRFFEIADASQVWILFEAYESDLPWLRYGQAVEFSVESFPGKTFQGVISFMPPELDPKTRTASIRVNVPNPDELLKPGMFVRGMVKASISDSGKVVDPSLIGKWISPMHPEVVKDGPGTCDVCGMALVKAEDLGYSSVEADAPLLVPVSAVLHTGKRSIVYIEMPDKEEPTFEGRDILLGPKAGDFYIVEAGLNEGERVVAEGGFVIDSALQIQAKNSMMLPGEREPLFRKIKVPASFLTGVDRVLQDYFGIQSALAGDSLERAKNSGAGGVDSLAKMDMKEVSVDAGEVWTDLKGKFQESFNLIAQSTDIKIARTEFKNLTAITDELVRRFGTGFLPVFEMYCPMAFNDTGASWFQADQDLLNPYFGSQMLKCGTVEKTLSPGKPFPLAKESNQLIEGLVQLYFSIAKDLAADDNAKAKSHSGELKQLVASFDAGKLDQSLSLAAWKTLSDSLVGDLEKMAVEDSISMNRVFFLNLSTAMKSVVNRFGGGLGFTVNDAHCPMAFNNEGGNWLTGSEEILNPYFGAKMLKCGEIVETIHSPAQ